MGKFVINPSQDGQYYFVLKADNGQDLVTSETYTTKESAKKGVDAVKAYAPTAVTVDNA